MIFSFTTSLIERLQKGDEEAFRIIYEQNWSRLYQLCFYYTRSREDTEDILISVFMSLWNNRDKADIKNIEHYLVKAAKNQSLKYILKARRQREQIRLFEQKKSLYDDNDSPEKLLELKELSGEIDNQLRLLPEKTQKIFLLNRENGLTYEQIARSLGVSVKTVEYHISKAIRLLSRYVLALIALLLLR